MTGINNHLNKHIKFYFISALFLMVWLGAFLVRTYHYNREADRISNTIADIPAENKNSISYWRPLSRKNFVPFTVESAIMYSYAHKVATGKSISGQDKQLVGMEDLNLADQMTLGLEYFLGYGYRLKNFILGSDKTETSSFEDDPDFSRWARFQLRLWASLASGFIFLWLIVMRCPWYWALAGAFLHVISPAAIARYTGQDMVRGEFCLPLVVAVFLLAYWFFRKASNFKLILLGIVTFLAISTWDMCQIIFGLWGLIELLRIVLGGTVNIKRRNAWTVIYMAMVLAALFIPYHRTHFLLLSPALFIVYPAILSIYCFGLNCKYTKRIAIVFISAILLFICWKVTLATSSNFTDNYSHFGELLKAKLRFNNVKPRNPEFLNFDARILWTPAMHSANRLLMKLFFPAAFYFFCLLLGAGLLHPKVRRKMKKNLGRLFLPALLTIFYFIGFIYIVRYHVFCVLFLAVSMPFLIDDWFKALSPPSLLKLKNILSNNTPTSDLIKSFIPKILIVLLLLLSLWKEGYISFNLTRAYEAEYFRETAQLVQWLRQSKVKDKSILTNMGLSPQLKAYCGAKIILQPKFELGNTRKAVEKYINLMFHGTEQELNKFCVKNKVDFLIYDRGDSHLVPLHPYSNRYMAAALKVDKTAPAWFMYQQPNKCRWFYRLSPPKNLKRLELKYNLFKVIQPKDVMDSMKMVFEGKAALRKGQINKARILADQAFKLDPNSESAYIFYFDIFNRIPSVKLKDYCEINKK